MEMDKVTNILIGIIAIILGIIALIDRVNTNQKGRSLLMYKGSGVALITFGLIYIIYNLIN